MEKSINEVLEKRKKEFEDFFSGTKTDIETAATVNCIPMGVVVY